MGDCCDVSGRGGFATVMATLLLSIGWALNAAAIGTCRFVTVDGLRDTDQADQTLVTAFGMYTFQGTDIYGSSYCYLIEYTTFSSNLPFWTDPKMNSARITGGTAAFMTFCCMIFCWCALCCGCLKIKGVRRALAFFSLLGCALAGCMFLVNNSNFCAMNACSFSMGGGLVIGAMLAYVAAGVLFCAAPDDELGEDILPPQVTATSTAIPTTNPEAGTVTIEKTELADGTVTTKKTTVNADGSQTVEETTETPMYDAKV
mmetsp:Transcript_4784/g.10638  ORF Transcript_4784/g.10638 Transcript_4784/m.10638 type:complete len:259 (-) Transcript_4784:85-861(-)|eukprot:CAMPEP_0178512840 /NCGR_PEP_ID=MMETSP0696-20121128/23129_1 /TAXON_ID=265572 /ORGANISM="Extubocellulus spinifer, Strain CCMP396" /LENGTH=258 /DNA_ID=CAMNT_0020142745 /DNA_START=133 /DNA_END=909 /DNA_ORIENTATION=-